MKDLLDKNSKFTHNVRRSIFSDLTKEYKFLYKGIIGKSVCGRSIDFLHLGNKNKMILWVAAHHGMEWLTSMVVLKFLGIVCENTKNQKKIYGVDIYEQLKKVGLMVIPCLNPDGVEISLRGSLAAGKYSKLVEKVSKGNTSSWQANARGVDLNHNYDAGWNDLHTLERKNGIYGPSPTRYGGNFPHSEPETFSLTSLCVKNNFKYAVAFHSQGEEIYWDYGVHTPEASEKMASILAFASGYEVSNPEGLAIGGGFKDWFIEKMKKPAFTIEIGRGKNPLPVSCLNEVYEKIERMLLISLLL